MRCALLSRPAERVDSAPHILLRRNPFQLGTEWELDIQAQAHKTRAGDGAARALARPRRASWTCCCPWGRRQQRAGARGRQRGQAVMGGQEEADDARRWVLAAAAAGIHLAWGAARCGRARHALSGRGTSRAERSTRGRCVRAVAGVSASVQLWWCQGWPSLLQGSGGGGGGGGGAAGTRLQPRLDTTTDLSLYAGTVHCSAGGAPQPADMPAWWGPAAAIVALLTAAWRRLPAGVIRAREQGPATLLLAALAAAAGAAAASAAAATAVSIRQGVQHAAGYTEPFNAAGQRWPALRPAWSLWGHL